MQLIGNAVPPLLAEQIAHVLCADLVAATTSAISEGSLLSFVPTLSSGVSPALKKVIERVETAFFGRAIAQKLF